MKKSVWAVLLAVMLVVMLLPMSVLAAPETKNISTVDELVQAIQNQEDGQTWIITAGTYDLGNRCVSFPATINGVTGGFVFPITASNLTIRGEGDVLITSTYDSNTGNWSGQNFLTVSGANVTIENVDLQGNPNSYYGGVCNKVVELIGGAKDFTLKDSTLKPLTDSDGKQNSGSIYVNVADAGTTTLENVTMYSWISARAVTTGTVQINNVRQDFTNNIYAGYSDETYGYAWNPGVSGDHVALNGFTIVVDNNTNLVKQVADNLRAGTTVELAEDVQVTEMLYITADDVTINGNGHTITAADDYAVGSHGQNNLVKVQADNVTLNNVTLKTTEANKHALDVYSAQNLTLNNVSLDHTNAQSGAPLINNGSQINVTGSFALTTGEKSWYGINIDNKNGAASLNFAEDVSATYSDNRPANNAAPLVFVEETQDTAAAPITVTNADKAGLGSVTGGLDPVAPVAPVDPAAPPKTGDISIIIMISALTLMLSAAFVCMLRAKKNAA